MSSQAQGRREIESARKRLATAEKHATSTAKSLESATQAEYSANKTADAAKKIAELVQKSADAAKINADLAKYNAEKVTENRKATNSQYADSKKEVAEAEKFLKDAEGRWEVVDIDSDNGPEKNERRKKQKMAVADTILVEDCGMSEVKGTYKLSAEMHNGVRQYCKQGQWKGRIVEYDIYFDSYAKFPWKIGIETTHDACDFYNAPTTGSVEVPPLHGWTAVSYGFNPPPTLKCMRYI